MKTMKTTLSPSLHKLRATTITLFLTVVAWTAIGAQYVIQPGPADSKDIWTTSVYSFAGGAGIPGGGLNDNKLHLGGWGDLYYSLIQFDLSQVPPNATSAVLYLYCFYNNNGSGTPMYLDRITQAWDWRTSGTGPDRERLWWADRPAATQWIPNTIPAGVPGQWYAVNITGLYNAWQSGLYPNYGLQLRPQLNWNNWNSFYSGDYTGDPTLRPKLVITAPAPVAPAISVPPQSQSVQAGVNVTFAVTATGTPPLNYQWRKNGVNLAGANIASLTLNSVRVSDSGRYSVVVWNPAGSLVSAPADLVVLADPANGTPPGLLTYSSLPAKQDGKDSLVLLTHGWSPDIPLWPDTPPSDVPWLNDLAGSVSGYLGSHALGNWQVVAYKWLANSFTLLPDKAAENGAAEGKNVGLDIVKQRWSHVHLIGNSAGAAFIQGATDMIKAFPSSSIVVHETFLDPYLQIGYPGRSSYGRNADWADCYFAHDYLTDDLGSLILQPALTEGRLANAYNVNVTQLDPSALLVPDGRLINPLDFEVISSHDWPHEFYSNTVAGSQAGAEGLGFPLSKEGGGWANHGSYPPGNQPRVLGNLAMVVQNESSTVVNGALRVGELVSQVSPSGVVQFLQNGFHALTGIGGGPSPKGPQPKDLGGLPVWVSFAVPVTNQVNFVTFEAQFDSTNGAVGLLSVYWGTNLIGTVDERVVVPGQQRYSFALPEVTPTGLYLLGFRLDPHSDVQSSVNVTNIATGFSGVTVPIQLQIAHNATNSNPAITLTAAPGFYYQLQSSADLKNWTPLASVLNTNGTAQIIDTTTNSLGQRFYRALLP